MNKVGVLFAGQGSQYIGMGQDFYNEFDYVREIYKKANSILGYEIESICFKENDMLNQTIFTQPSILTTSIGIYTAFLKELNIKPNIVEGFSLGEYSALFAARVFDFETIIKLVKYRAKLMNEAAEQNKGAMAAIIGLEKNILEKLCQNESEFVHIANYNCSTQFVVSGTENAVKNICEKAKAVSARRAIILNVSGAFHSPLMSGAAKKMLEVLQKTKFSKPSIPIVMNCNAQYLNEKDLFIVMKKQIESSVYFEDSVKLMIKDGVDTFIEIGPGNVLTALVKKIDPNMKVITINKLSDLNNLKGEI